MKFQELGYTEKKCEERVNTTNMEMIKLTVGTKSNSLQIRPHKQHLCSALGISTIPKAILSEIHFCSTNIKCFFCT